MPEPRISGTGIILAVCEHFAISPKDLIAATRKQKIAVPRQIAMYLMRRYGGKANGSDYSYAEIARMLRRKDHTTIVHGCQKIAGNLATFGGDIAKIKKALGIP